MSRGSVIKVVDRGSDREEIQEGIAIKTTTGKISDFWRVMNVR
jgi:hypothetical protein